MNFNFFKNRVHITKDELFFIYNEGYEQIQSVKSILSFVAPHNVFDAIIVHFDYHKTEYAFKLLKNILTENGFFCIYCENQANYKFIINLLSGKFGTPNYFLCSGYLFIQPNVFNEETKTGLPFNKSKIEYIQIFSLYVDEINNEEMLARIV